MPGGRTGRTRHGCVDQPGSIEDHIVQIGAREVAARQVRPYQTRAGQVGSCKRRVGEVEPGQIHALQVGASEICAFHATDTREGIGCDGGIDSVTLAVGEIRPGEIGPGEDHSLQTDVLGEACADKRGSAEIDPTFGPGACKACPGQIRAPKVDRAPGRHTHVSKICFDQRRVPKLHVGEGRVRHVGVR